MLSEEFGENFMRIRIRKLLDLKYSENAVKEAAIFVGDIITT